MPKTVQRTRTPKPSRTTTRTYQIGVIPGDGTGPEVVAEGRKVLEAAAQRGHFQVKWRTYDVGGDRYLKTGEALPHSVLKELREVDAIRDRVLQAIDEFLARRAGAAMTERVGATA